MYCGEHSGLATAQQPLAAFQNSWQRACRGFSTWRSSHLLPGSLAWLLAFPLIDLEDLLHQVEREIRKSKPGYGLL